MRRCAVLGDPIAHSLSPALHGAGYAAAGLDWDYGAHRVPSGGLAAFVGGLSGEWRGLSVTMPLKRAALALARGASDRARLSGVANTLLVDEGPWADNTDIPGAAAALQEAGVIAVRSATVLGGGATATSVGLALADLGARRLRLVVRDSGRAAATAAVLRAHPERPEVELVALGDPGPPALSGAVVVSTVPAGAQTPGLVEMAAAASVVFDVVYDPWPTPLVAAASAAGAVVVDGLELLVQQAAVQFALFTGRPAPVAAMRAAGREALAARVAGG